MTTARKCTAVVASMLAALAPGMALAHTPGQAAGWQTSIRLDELTVILPLALVGWIYARGWNHTRRPWRGLAFVLAIVAIIVALLSPLDSLSEGSFAAHMTQHMLLIDVAAPLFLVSRPLPELLRGLDPGVRRQAIRALKSPVIDRAGVVSQPVVAWFIFTIVFWSWHAPSFYEAAVQNAWIHATEHAALVVAALLFWWPVLGWKRRRRLDAPAAILYLFVASLQGSGLGALMVFATAPWYSGDANVPFGLSPIADQQLAGIVMWLITTLVFMGVGGWMFVRWMSEPHLPRSPETATSHPHYAIRYSEERP